MATVTGIFFKSIAGDFGAVLKTATSDVQNGLVFIQSAGSDALTSDLRNALALHFQADGHFGDWVIAPMTVNENSMPIAISQSSFSLKSHQYAYTTLVYERESVHNKDGFVTYKIGSMRFTIPSFEASTPSPELLHQIFSEYKNALQLDPKTKDNVDQILRSLFATIGR